MANTACKEEEISDIKELHSKSNNLEVQHIDLDEIHCHTENAAACHFYYPLLDGASDKEPVEDQQDPLAFKSECAEVSTFQSEIVAIEDELFGLEQASSSSFSIIDPLNIAKSNASQLKVKSEKEEQNVFKSKSAQILEVSRKRKIEENDVNGSVSDKRLCIESGLKQLSKSHGCKHIQINIGPKLPLPQIFAPNKPLCQSLEQGTPSEECTRNINCNQTTKFPSEAAIDRKTSYICSKRRFKTFNRVEHEAHFRKHATRYVNKVPCHQSKDLKCKNSVYCCENCSFKFKNKHNLLSHDKKHFKDKGFCCYICKMEQFSVGKLHNHFNEIHKNLIKLYFCNICVYSSKNVRNLRDHMIRHNLDKDLFCYMCRRNYEDKEDFDQHFLVSHNKSRAHRKKVNKKQLSPNYETLKSHFSTDAKELAEMKSRFDSEIIYKESKYQCNGCSYKFSSIENLKKHKKEHLKANKPYKCSSCTHRSFSLMDLGKHLKVHLSQKSKVKTLCNICDKSFDTWYNLRQHAVCHVYDGLFCNSCRVNFEDAEYFSQHMLLSHNHSKNDKMYSCSTCSFTHFEACAFKRHSLKHLEDEKNKKDNSVSEIPSLEEDNFIKKYTEDEITLREQSEHKSVTAVTGQEEGYITQKEMEQTKFIFKCNKCCFECGNVNFLEKHDNTVHSKELMFTCSECDLKLLSLKSFMAHLENHNNVNNFSCEYCDYTTTTKSSFSRHSIRHTFKHCPMCVYIAKTFEALKNHVSKQHESRNQPYKCTLCPYSAHDEKSLSIHCIKFHPEQYPSLKLSIPKHLIGTKYNQHLSRNEKNCRLCSFKSKKNHDFKRHITRHFLNGQLKSSLNKKLIKSNFVGKRTYLLKSVENDNCKRRETKLHNKLSLSFDKSKILLNYLCSQCEFRSKNRRTVQSHLKSVHKKLGGLKNNMILKHFEPQSLNKVRPAKNTSKITFPKCRLDCEIKNLSEQAQKQHKRYGHSKFWSKPLCCNQCGARFSKDQNLKNHKCIKEHTRKTLTCKTSNKKVNIHSQVCGLPTEVVSKGSACLTITKPIINQASEEFSDDECFSCGECNFVTSNVTELITHMFIHSGIPDD